MSSRTATTPLPRKATHLARRFADVRAATMSLAAPLSAEDQCIQSMPDASPTKWHLAHTTWFFETFILGPSVPGYTVFDASFNYLFNSYYEQVGPRHARPERGMLTRPALSEVHDYRAYVDDAMTAMLAQCGDADVLALVELGLNHEQQHQELLLTDIKHALSKNPTHPGYQPPRPRDATRGLDTQWLPHPGGLGEVGWHGNGFAFDCEGPRHKVWLEPFRLASHPVSNGEYLAFMNDGGYTRPDLWLSDGWAACQAHGWQAPGYWHQDDGGTWRLFTLAGLRPIDPDSPVCHVSFYEADAFARWRGARLPTEAEWETLAADHPVHGNFADSGIFHPLPAAHNDEAQFFGDVWEWTGSAYSPYPGFKTADGAVGEYNGKFMSGQMVLRGGSCATPADHMRASYRNFFPPAARWQFSGIRLAEDAPAVTRGFVDAVPGTFRGDVLRGLASSPKTLPPKYFYDAEGARLFTEICTLDEYYPTRTEIGILTDNAAEIAKAVGGRAMLIEYGSGALDKVRILLDALDTPVALTAIDISAEQLRAAAADVEAAYPGLEVLAVEADFTKAVKLPKPAIDAASRVAFFPGSTIGNFNPGAALDFLKGIRETVGDDGQLLIGVDLKKSPSTLTAAYNDAKGVTAAFNKNVLVRINSELDGDIDLDLFRHTARYNAVLGRIEMHLESLTDQTVHAAGEAFAFAAGETIHTENSYKFTVAEFSDMAGRAGFAVHRTWQDGNALFAVMLLGAKPA